MAGMLTVMMMASNTKPAAAQASDAADRCTPDVMRLCSEFVPDADRIVTCLKAKRKHLGRSCEAARQPAGGEKRKRRTGDRSVWPGGGGPRGAPFHTTDAG